MASYTIKIFYCYAHEDDGLREQLARHLIPLRRLRHITGWFDRDIQAGTDWEQEIGTHLDSASIILLLISADFIASDYCYNIEMERALEKHKAGTARVIPIILRPVAWEETPIGKLQALPTGKKPITQWKYMDSPNFWHNAKSFWGGLGRCSVWGYGVGRHDSHFTLIQLSGKDQPLF